MLGVEVLQRKQIEIQSGLISIVIESSTCSNLLNTYPGWKNLQAHSGFIWNGATAGSAVGWSGLNIVGEKINGG